MDFSGAALAYVCAECRSPLEQRLDEQEDGTLAEWVCPSCPGQPVRGWMWSANEGKIDLGPGPDG